MIKTSDTNVHDSDIWQPQQVEKSSASAVTVRSPMNIIIPYIARVFRIIFILFLRDVFQFPSPSFSTILLPRPRYPEDERFRDDGLIKYTVQHNIVDLHTCIYYGSVIPQRYNRLFVIRFIPVRPDENYRLVSR